MRTDTIRLVSSSIIAVALAIGGLYAVYQMARDHLITGGEALAVIGPLIGVAVAWALGRDAATQGARSYAAGVDKGSNSTPSMTVTSGPPASATVTPAPPTETPGDSD